MEKKFCPECGFKIIGRKDKKFCSDQCRNTFNNRLNRDANKHIRRINFILRKNRRILEDVATGRGSQIQTKAMREKGFDFNYYTHIITDTAGKTCFFCYDIGYCFGENDQVVAVV